jgi:hypothetical protein
MTLRPQTASGNQPRRCAAMHVSHHTRTIPGPPSVGYEMSRRRMHGDRIPRTGGNLYR